MSHTTAPRQDQGQAGKSVHTLGSGLTRPIAGTGTTVADSQTATPPTLHSQRLKAQGQVYIEPLSPWVEVPGETGQDDEGLSMYSEP